MTHRDKIDQCFDRLAQAPIGLDMNNGEVLCALGLLVNAILHLNFSDPTARQEKANSFCRALQIATKRDNDAIVRH
jgi:hypothetical protein